MSVRSRLALYLAGLVLVFAMATALGAAVGPLDGTGGGNDGPVHDDMDMDG